MAAFDELIERLNDPARRLTVSDRQEAALCIAALQKHIRDYNPDDEIFDDEKSAARPLSTTEISAILGIES